MAASAERAETGGADALLVGGSGVISANIDEVMLELKKHVTIPVITFPGNADQVSRHADALLFTSLLSGRNAEFLVGEQVKAAPLVYAYGLETIPTGYLLIESGIATSVQYLSHTQPIPRHKSDIARAHALAAQYFGMKLVYLEAGSGARYSVPEDMISVLAPQVSLPMICGGGIRRPEDAQAKVTAGARFIVIGNHFEQGATLSHYREFAEAIHCKQLTTS